VIHGALKFHFELSLLTSNLARAGVLSPEETSANFSFEPGTALGMNEPITGAMSSYAELAKRR
jgi:hypothetical protein